MIRVQKKNIQGDFRTWWLRSCNGKSEKYVGIVYVNGLVYNYDAFNEFYEDNPPTCRIDFGFEI